MTRFLQSSLLVIVLIISGQAKMQAQSMAQLNELKSMAKMGDPKATYQLAQLYEKGLAGRNISPKKIFSLYMDAATTYDSAQYAVGRLLETGYGTDQNHAQALRYYERAANSGHAVAAFRSGKLYESGVGVVANASKAVDHYLKAYRLGYKEAQKSLDNLPVTSLGDKNTLEYAWYMAEKGDPASEYRLAEAYMKGGVLPKNPQKALDYYLKSARSEYPQAQFALARVYEFGLLDGNQYLQRPNIRLAVVNYLRAANNGIADAEKALAKYEIRKYLPAEDKDYLIYKARQDGAGGDDEQYQLYLRYLNGIGVEKDVEKALEYCQMAALSNNEDAMMALGRMYESGTYVEKNLRNSFIWYREAAKVGNDSARYVLAEMYATGKGTEIDLQRAVRWYLKVAGAQKGELSVMAMYKLQRFDILKFIDPNDLDYISYLGMKGDVNAQMRLGRYYLAENDAKAVDWLKLAAEAGIPEAQKLLGDIYLFGKCKVVVDAREAAVWYYEAANQNDVQAMKQLAFMFSQKLIPNMGNNYQRGMELAQKYLEITQQNPAMIDYEIYKIIADLFSENTEFNKAVYYYTLFINSPKSADSPYELIKALDGRAVAYFQIGDTKSSLNDLEVGLMQLEKYRQHEDIIRQYDFLKGVLTYQLGKVVLEQGNTLRACDAFQRARALGIQIEQRHLQICGVQGR